MPCAPSNRPSVRPPLWVRNGDELTQMVARVRGSAIVAIDSESDSLHHFPEKVCLIQVGTVEGEVFLVDPLGARDLAPLAPMLADPNVVKVLHGAAYDLASMKRDFAFEILGLFDTMVAAQFLGLPEVGLAALLKGILGIESGESRQKDDWAVRPLSAAQEHYAAEDVRHLFLLRARLMDSLAACGRAGWVEEECRALEGTPAADRVFHPDDCFAIKGVRILDRRGLAILRELFVAREVWARERGRPPFKVLGNETLLRVATARPETRDALAHIPGCTPTVVARYGDGVLQAVARGLAVPTTELPIPRRAAKPRLAPVVERRIGALLAWRADAAPRVGLDPGLLLPRRLIEPLAQRAPANLPALEAVDGMRRWRVVAFGAEILAALSGGNGATAPRPGPRESLSGDAKG